MSNLPKNLILVPQGTGRSKSKKFPKLEEIEKLIWIDAADTSTIEETEGQVDKINDKSGNSANLTQTSTGRRPHTNTRTINNLNVLDLRFNQFMECKTNFRTPENGELMIFCVGEYVGTTTSVFSGGYWGMSKNGGMPILNLMPYNKTQFDATLVYASGTPPAFYGSHFKGYPYNDPTIFSLTKNAREPVFRKFANGNICGTTNSSEKWQADEMNELFVGRNTTSPANNTVPCGIGELIIVPTQNDQTRKVLEGYLAWKWGLVRKLPVAHPYKNHKPE